MRSLAGLPGLRALADNTVRLAGDGLLVMLHLPGGSGKVSPWQELLAEALEHSLGGMMLPERHVLAPRAEDSPRRALRAALGGRPDDPWEELLLPYGDRESPVLLECPGGGSAFEGEWPRAWRSLAAGLTRTFETHMTRKVIVLTRGLDPERWIRDTPTIRNLALWNVCTPAELRALAHDVLGPEIHTSLVGLWRIATYSGAANTDPILFERLCTRQPTSLDEVARCVLANLPERAEAERYVSERHWRLTGPAGNWIVPAPYAKAWAAGDVLGVSLATGPIMHFAALPSEHRRTYLNRLVWREQIACLMHVIAEMSAQCARWVTDHVDADWSRYINDQARANPDAVEPATLLDAFSANRHRLRRLPDGLRSLLKSLRSARNALAHLQPLEATVTDRLWTEFTACAGRYDESSFDSVGGAIRCDQRSGYTQTG